MKIVISATASNALESAADYYFAIHPPLSQRLLSEFEYIIGLLADYPSIYQLTSIGLRVASFHSFPYELYYRHSLEVIEIIHILPARMDPKSKITSLNV